jgi:hypothetical protein
MENGGVFGNNSIPAIFHQFSIFFAILQKCAISKQLSMEITHFCKPPNLKLARTNTTTLPEFPQ